MKSLDLYKFVTDNQLLLFIPYYLIDDWSKLLGSKIFKDEGIECIMKCSYFCFWMMDICDRFDIDMYEIFKI